MSGSNGKPVDLSNLMKPPQAQLLVGFVMTPAGPQMMCNIAPAQALNMLTAACEDLRTHIIIERLKNEQRVQVVDPASVPPLKVPE